MPTLRLPTCASCVIIIVLAACSSQPETAAPKAVDIDSILLSTPTASELASPVTDQASEVCINDARFVEDLTIPDRYKAEPGEELDKRWGVLNAGSCDWTAGYRLVRIDDGPIEATTELALYPARAGETGVWAVQITVPRQTGDQIASWQAQAPDGSFFGDPVFVLIEVVP